MTKQNQYDKQFQGKALADLTAMRPYITAALERFKEAENVEQTFTYTCILEALDRAISDKSPA